jgi:hypothetical protein
MRRLLCGLAILAMVFSAQAQSAGAVQDQYRMDPATKYKILAVQRTESGTVTGAIESVDAASRTSMMLPQPQTASLERYLVDKGVDSDCLETVSNGWDRPAAPNETAAQRVNNRRVDFAVVE